MSSHRERAVLGLVLACSAVLVARAALAAPDRIAPGPVVIQVVGAKDREPVPGALVRLGGRHQATSAAGQIELDGVPSGTYRLAIAQPGFETEERSVSLGAGKRDTITVTLTQATLVSVQGRVRIADTGADLAGARIRLSPRAVRAAVSGPYELTTGWDGSFRIVEMPAGRYRANVTKAGCRALDAELEVSAGMPDVDWRLVPESQPARLSVTVRHASGGPVSGARVVLAEAGTIGTIGEALTGADGLAVFDRIALGRLNRADRDGRLTIARRLATVRVEARDCEPAIANVTLGANTSATVRLGSTARIDETEPNDTLQAAKAIGIGAPVQLKIGTPKDRDTFRFRLDYPSAITVAIGPDNPIQTLVRLMDPAGKVLRECAAQAGSTNTIQAGGLSPGDYLVQVEEWGNDAASERPLTLLVSAAAAPDAHEPDDRPEDARLVETDEELRGTLLPRGDADWYRFELRRPSHVRLTMPPHGLQRLVAVVDAAGRTISDRGAQPDQPLELVVGLGPGTFRVCVREWGDDAESVAPYTLRIEETSDDGVDDPTTPANPMTAVRELALGGLAGSTLFPVGDADVYALSVPGPGRLHVSTVAPTQVLLKILDIQGRVLADEGAQGGARSHRTVDFEGPATVFVRVEEWGNDECSRDPYVVSAWFEPSDETESAARNDSVEASTPVAFSEPIRGTILPRGDVDWYAFEVDHPGWLRLEGRAPTQLLVALRDARQQELLSRGAQNGEPLVVEHPVLPGTYFLSVREWGDDATSVASYALVPSLRRAEPMETVPLSADPIRTLTAGEAQAFRFDHAGDRDRFAVDVPAAGTWRLRIRGQNQILIKVFDDRTGARLLERGAQIGDDVAIPLDAKGPTRYRIELSEWGDDAVSHEPCFVMISPDERDIPGEWVTARADPVEPTRVTFTRVAATGMKGGTGFRLASPDAKAAAPAATGPTLERRYAAEGVYPDVAWIEGTTARTRVPVWVEATGNRERTGVQVTVDHPAEGAVVDVDAPVRARAVSFTGSRVASVAFRLDDKPVGVVRSAPFAIDLPWASLSAGEHTLTCVATDSQGHSGTTSRRFRLSAYFALTPADRAVVSGNEVRVRWTGASFGPAVVRWREQGATLWNEARGEDGKSRVVRLTGLAPGKCHEFQPLPDDRAAGEPGPVRCVTRVKGLAFGSARYAATIRRDYDQKTGISVRNQGDEPLVVRLACGKPEDPSLLAGFVGEGSEGAPIPLAPGEEREFWLGLSAQDVNRAHHRFPIRLTSATGLADEAEVDVTVRLPDVKLEWEALGPAAHGLGQRYRLHNRGDGVTDLSVTSSTPGVIVSPAIEHAPFTAGASLELTAQAVLAHGFSGVEGTLTAGAVDKRYDQPFRIALREGERVFRVRLEPGGGAGAAKIEESDRQRASDAAVEALDPAGLDWSARTGPEDTDGDGRADRWKLVDAARAVDWYGDDTDADGVIDAVHADVGADGSFELAALATPQGWERTNVVDAWLEVAFGLPWARSAYEKHDVDVVFNGQVVGRLRDVIPEGNYTFRVPPRLIQFGDDGVPAGNAIGIDSRHLRGGHYVVSNEYRLKVRLTSTPVWVVATSEAAALDQAAKLDGVSASTVDLSVSSGDVRLSPATGLQKGTDVSVEVPVKSLGAVCPDAFDVALMSSGPGAPGVEVARVTVSATGKAGPPRVTIPWKAAAGAHVLKVVVDPDTRLADSDRTNNEAMVAVAVPGDDARPTVTVHAPVSGATLTDPITPVSVEATDDSGFVQLAMRIDGGMWQPAGGPGRHAVPLLLQPGAHEVKVRATDGGGNTAEQSLRLTVATTTPAIQVLEPASGASIDATAVDVRFAVRGEAVLVAARAEGGAWHRGTLEAGVARVSVPLSFGTQQLELVAAGPRGALGSATLPVTRTRQVTPDETRTAPGTESGAIRIAGAGTVDLFAARDAVLWTEQGPALALVPRPRPLAAGATLTFAGTRGEGYVTAALTAQGVVITHLKSDGTLVARCEGDLAALDERGQDFYGTTRVVQGARVGNIEYGLSGDGLVLQTEYTRQNVSSRVTWVRVKSVGDPRPWYPDASKE